MRQSVQHATVLGKEPFLWEIVYVILVIMMLIQLFAVPVTVHVSLAIMELLMIVLHAIPLSLETYQGQFVYAKTDTTKL